MGAARVGAGGVQGALAGQHAEIALRQQQAMMQYRNALMQSMLGYRMGMLGLRQQGLDQRAVAPYVHALADVNNNGFFSRNPDILAQYQGIIGGQMHPGAGFGFNPNTNTVSIPGGGVYGADGPIVGPGGPVTAPGADTGAGTGTTGAPPPPSPGQAATDFLSQNPQAPFTADAARPENYSPTGEYTGPNTQPSLFEQIPPAAGATPGLRTANLGPVREQAFGPQQMWSAVPPQPMPQVFAGETESDRPALAKPAAPASPPSAASTGASTAAAGTTGSPPPAALSPTQDPNNPLYLGYLPQETDHARALRIGNAARVAGLDIRQILLPNQVKYLQSRAGLAEAGTILTGEKAAEEPEAFAARQKNIAARTAETGTRAGFEAAETKAVAPRTAAAVAQAGAAISRVQEYARHNQVTEQQARNELASQDNLRQAEKTRINAMMGSTAVKGTPAEKAQFATNSKIYFSGHTDATGDFALDFKDPQRYQAWQGMNSYLAQHGQAPIRDPGFEAQGGGSPAPALGTPGNPARSSAAGTAQAPPSAQELSSMKKMMGAPGGVHGFMAREDPATQARMRYVFSKMNPGKSL